LVPGTLTLDIRDTTKEGDTMLMTDQISPEKAAAVRRLSETFENIPQSWARLAAQHEDGEEYLAMPMWGTLFLVSNMDRGNIEKLLTSPVPEGDAVALLEFAEDHGIELDESEMQLLALAARDEDDDDEADLDSIRDQILEAWRESNDEDAMLADSGWQDVGDSGFIAREIDGELLMGVNGAGYSFHDSHWLRLYDELGYSWHQEGERQQRALEDRRKAVELLKAIDTDEWRADFVAGELRKAIALLEGE
jgi:hypothetical protein